jgi:hypothetical protein
MEALLLSPTPLSHMLSHHMAPNLGRATTPGEDVIVANELEMLVVGRKDYADGKCRCELDSIAHHPFREDE